MGDNIIEDVPLSDSEIDKWYSQGTKAGSGFSAGSENQTPLEAAEQLGLKRIRTFDTRLSSQQGAVGFNEHGEVIAIVDEHSGPWAINITTEIVMAAESLD